MVHGAGEEEPPPGIGSGSRSRPDSDSGWGLASAAAALASASYTYIHVHKIRGRINEAQQGKSDIVAPPFYVRPPRPLLSLPFWCVFITRSLSLLINRKLEKLISHSLHASHSSSSIPYFSLVTYLPAPCPGEEVPLGGQAAPVPRAPPQRLFHHRQGHFRRTFPP